MFKYFLCMRFALAAAFAAGCSSTPQNKLPATSENYNAYSLRCKDLAKQTISTNILTTTPGGTRLNIALPMNREIFESCMREAGYEQPQIQIQSSKA